MHGSTIRFWRMHAVEMGRGGDRGFAPSSRPLNEGGYLTARLALSGLRPTDAPGTLVRRTPRHCPRHSGGAGFFLQSHFVKLAYAVPQAVPVDSVTLLALRMVFSLPAFAWVGWKASRNLPPLTLREWGWVTALGLLGYYGASILDFMGLQYITASLERLILFTYPTLTILIGVVFLGKTASRRGGALLLSYAGIGLAFAHDLHIAGEMRAVLIGAAFVLGSSVSYAFYQAGSEPVIRRLGAARFTALAMLVSTVATFAALCREPALQALAQPAPVYLHAVGMAVFSTVLPVFMTSAAIRRDWRAHRTHRHAGPMLTIFFGYWLLAEPMSVWQMMGAGLVLAGCCSSAAARCDSRKMAVALTGKAPAAIDLIAKCDLALQQLAPLQPHLAQMGRPRCRCRGRACNQVGADHFFGQLLHLRCGHLATRAGRVAGHGFFAKQARHAGFAALGNEVEHRLAQLAKFFNGAQLHIGRSRCQRGADDGKRLVGWRLGALQLHQGLEHFFRPMAQRLKPCPGHWQRWAAPRRGALAMRCSCHCTKSCPSGSYAVVSAPVKGCEWRGHVGDERLVRAGAQNRKCPGVPGWAFTASRAAFRACSRLVPSSVPSACCTSSTISTTSTLALATSSEKTPAPAWHRRACPGVQSESPGSGPRPQVQPLKRCSRPEPGVCICCSVARTASSTRVAGLLLRSAHRSTYTTRCTARFQRGHQILPQEGGFATRRMPTAARPSARSSAGATAAAVAAPSARRRRCGENVGGHAYLFLSLQVNYLFWIKR